MSELLKMIEMVMNFTVSKSRDTSAQLLITARKLILLALLALGAMTLFCVGIVIVVADLARQVENPMIIGIVLSLSSAIVLLICFQKKSWIKTKPVIIDQGPKIPSPIETALALLITDIVSERQTKRNETSP